MKTGGSSLNPHAVAYVPLSKRGVSEQGSVTAQGSENAWYGKQPANTWRQGQHQNVYVQAKWKDHNHPVGDFNASSSQYLHELPGKSNVSEELDIDLAYLQMTYPGISEESLSDVYFASNYDLDAAVDMLDQLELHPDDSFGKLPDNNATAEASTSGSSNLSTTAI